jgi:hypothetical protein
MVISYTLQIFVLVRLLPTEIIEEEEEEEEEEATPTCTNDL